MHGLFLPGSDGMPVVRLIIPINSQKIKIPESLLLCFPTSLTIVSNINIWNILYLSIYFISLIVSVVSGSYKYLQIDKYETITFFYHSISQTPFLLGEFSTSFIIFFV